MLEQCISSQNDIECQMEFIFLGEMISKFLRQLPEEHRNVFVCRYWYTNEFQIVDNYESISNENYMLLNVTEEVRISEYSQYRELRICKL